MLRLFFVCLLSVTVAACIQAKGEWKVVRGSDFPEEKIGLLKEHESTAGTVIQELGVPYHRKDETYLYAVRRERPVIRTYFVYSTPLTQEVTLEAKILFQDGYVRHIESERYERFLPRTP